LHEWEFLIVLRPYILYHFFMSRFKNHFRYYKPGCPMFSQMDAGWPKFGFMGRNLKLTFGSNIKLAAAIQPHLDSCYSDGFHKPTYGD